MLAVVNWAKWTHEQQTAARRQQSVVTANLAAAAAKADTIQAEYCPHVVKEPLLAPETGGQVVDKALYIGRRSIGFFIIFKI